LFVALSIEVAAAGHAKGLLGRRKKYADTIPKDESYHRDRTWGIVAFAHSVNATLCLAITSTTVYYHIHHPLLGTISELHAIIVWLKICSYAFTNRDLRQDMLRFEGASHIPETYSICPYPLNITLGNLCYFWWAPTLVYQPVYPRTPKVRWGFVAKRLAEVASLSVFIWLASAQYAAPTLRNSLQKMVSFDIASIVERLMKLSIISSIIWLAGFFAVFQSMLNALAEIMRFGDREFYTDWWNSPSVGAYWRTWNKPVYNFMKRHIFLPLVARGWSNNSASAMVFIFSGILHEALVGIPTHNILGQSHSSSRGPANSCKALHS
jgi:diacylglycerol O-acyltransferase 1